jgi:hypothetical protein
MKVQIGPPEIEMGLIKIGLRGYSLFKIADGLRKLTRVE